MEIKDAHEIHIPAKPREALEDRKLLDRPSRETRLQSESWRVLRITSEFVAGFDHLADVYPAVSMSFSLRATAMTHDASCCAARSRIERATASPASAASKTSFAYRATSWACVVCA